MSRRKPSKRSASSSRTSAATQPGRSSNRPARSSRRGLTLVIALVTAAACAALLGFWYARPTPKTPQTKIPKISLSGMEDSAAATIQKQLEKLRMEPTSAAAWGWLGAILNVYNLFELGNQCLAEAERLDPANPRWPYFQSLALTADAPEEAIAKARRAADLSGIDPVSPRLRLANLLAEQGDWEQAEEALKPLLASQPDNVHAHMIQALAAQARGDIAGAIAHAERCAQHPQTRKAAQSLLASLQLRAGNSTAAEEALQAAGRLPEDESMVDPFQIELHGLRQDPQLVNLQTHDLLAAGRLAEATANVEWLVKNHADQAETWLLQGRLSYLMKDAPGAESALRRHLELDPQSTQGYFQLGMVLMAQQRFPEAAQMFAEATRIKPDFGPAHFNQGYSLARSGQFTEAIPHFEEAVRQNPEHIDSYFLLTDLYLKLGDKAKATEWIEHAELVNASDPRILQLREKANALAN